MATLQQQARALGDPTRHAIFRHIAEADGPVGIAELTARRGLNHNAVRQHVAKLVDAGLVVETTARRAGPGRPRLVYAVDPAAESRWGVSGPYERLSLLLAEIIRSGDAPLEVGRRAAHRHPVSTASAEAAVADVVAAMAREGFDPEIRQGDGGVEVVLRRCPFASTALVDPGTVCALHLGLAEGLVQGGPIAVGELIARDPRSAHCRLLLEGARPG